MNVKPERFVLPRKIYEVPITNMMRKKKRMHDQVVLMFRREKKDCDVFDYIIFNTTQLKIISKQNEEIKCEKIQLFLRGNREVEHITWSFVLTFFLPI